MSKFSAIKEATQWAAEWTHQEVRKGTHPTDIVLHLACCAAFLVICVLGKEMPS